MKRSAIPMLAYPTCHIAALQPVFEGMPFDAWKGYVYCIEFRKV